MIHAGSTLDDSLKLTVVTGVKVNRWQKCHSTHTHVQHGNGDNRLIIQ